MRFTKDMYEQAIKDLQDGMTQLAPDGHCCAICGDSGHQAWECGSNPLYAMACCQTTQRLASELHDRWHVVEAKHDDDEVRAKFGNDNHEFLHWLSGSCTWMGELVGPGKVTRLGHVCINCDQRVDDPREHFDKDATKRPFWKCARSKAQMTIDTDIR